MKLTFLGTGAGEGYPGFFCGCTHCGYARRHGGRNVREYSAAVIDGAVMLDCGPTSFPNAARFGVDLTQIHTLLITHPHGDHLMAGQLQWRAAAEWPADTPYAELTQHGGARFTPIPDLAVYGNGFSEKVFIKAFDAAAQRLNRMTFTRVREGEAFVSGGYRVTPVRGNHGIPNFSHSYIIEKDGRALLYALDGGSYDDDQMALLASHTYNAVIMEGTYGLNEHGNGHHMSLDRNVDMLRFFRENGCCAPDFRFYLTHMSPHWCPPHDQYVDIAARHGLLVAYDGLEIEV